jgi:hypothetical protein
MKICWDNLENLRLNRNGYFTKNGYNCMVEVDSCKKCGESFLAYIQQIRKGKGKYCSKECSSPIQGKLHKHHPEESKIKIGLSSKERYKNKKNHPMYGKKGERSANWKGGCNLYLHEKAWELFGQNKCEVCGISNDEHKKITGYRLSMHCHGHNYKKIERDYWTTCCLFGCHQKLEKLDKEVV